MSRTDGFTLVETMAALAILGLIALALAGSLRVGGRLWDANHRQIEDAQHLRLTQELLRRSITQATPVSIGDEGRRHVAFLGGAEALSFVTPMPAHVSVGAYDLLRIETARGPDGRDDLVAMWDSFDPDSSRLEVGASHRQVVLVKDVAEVNFSYYGSDEQDTPPSWSGEWRERRALPTLVRMRVSFPKNSHRIWPDLVARPMIDAPAVLQ